MKSSIFLVLALLVSSTLMAQNVNDALRFASFDYSGTARFLGTGGSMGALGADLSVAGTNPAGIALFRKSEFTITPALFLNNTDSRLTAVDNINTISRTNFNFHNIGVVMTSEPSLAKGWSNVNFSVTLNNIANYNREFSYNGSTTGSITERWQEIANSSVGLDNFETGLAADAAAIYDIDDDPNDYETDYELSNQGILEKDQRVVSKGSTSELSFTFAGNYKERLMIGISIGVPIVYYDYESLYTESDDRNAEGGNVPYFESLEYEEKINTTGGGINAKLGLIYRVSQAVRIGGSIHTPTSIRLEDEYENNLINNYYEDADESGQFLGGSASSTGLFDYRLRTPWRFFGGAGFIFGQNGFLSAEIEYVNHQSNQFNFDGFAADENILNDDIRFQLEDVINVRLGGEFVMDKFRFRGGIGLFPSAYIGDDTQRYAISAGLGLREDNFYLDLAFRHSSEEEFFFPYFTEQASLQEVQNNFSLNRLILTFGAKF